MISKLDYNQENPCSDFTLCVANHIQCAVLNSSQQHWKWSLEQLWLLKHLSFYITHCEQTLKAPDCTYKQGLRLRSGVGCCPLPFLKWLYSHNKELNQLNLFYFWHYMKNLCKKWGEEVICNSQHHMVVGPCEILLVPGQAFPKLNCSFRK